MEPQRIGIVGGTFDPIHLGHLVAPQYAVAHLALHRVLFIPTAAPVHRPQHTPAPPEDRLEMCRLATRSVPAFETSDVEIARDAPSYTVLTLRQLIPSLGPDARLFLLIGEDNLPLLHTWRSLPEILRLATLALLPRPVPLPPDLGPLRQAVGADAAARILDHRVPAPALPVSATDIRARLAHGRSIAGLVPASVARYIAQRGLYGHHPPPPPPS